MEKAQCLGNPSGKVCSALDALGWVSPTQDFLEFIGVRDAMRCAEGSVSACVWTAVGFLPVGKLAKAAKLAKKGDNAAAAALACSRMSFLPGSQVLMADGSSKNIEDLRVGDEILTADPATGKTTRQRITAELLSEGSKNLVKITIEESSGKRQVITATDNHPFWVAALGEWVPAGQLTAGQWLQTSNGTYVQIAIVERWTQTARVYNLTVAGTHTYYVLAGETSVLVHNSTPCTPVIGPQLPTGVGDDWVARAADNGKGSVWQKPGSTGNADMLRVMNPTGRYPDGYVRFTNKHGQPIGLDGKPGSKADTHIPMNPDGTYPLPAGW